MSKFKKIKLNDIAAPGRSIISGPFGSNIGKRFFKDSGVPVIRGNNLTTDFKKFVDDGFVFLTNEKANELNSDAVEGDILFTAAGTIGQVGMIPIGAAYKRYVISNKQLRFRVDLKKADPNYVFYWLASPWIFKAILNRNTGSTVPLINLGIIKSLPISLPEDILEQKKIANVISVIDGKIEVNNRINTELEAMAKTLYDYWFVQNDKFCKWEVVKLGDCITVNERNITKDYSQNEIEYIDIASVSVGRLEGTSKYQLNNAPSRARRIVQNGDTIWSTVRPNRKSYLFISNPKDNLVVSTGFAVLTPKTIPPTFLYFFSITDKFVNYLVSNAEGSAYPAVSADRFLETELSMPPKKMLAEFEEIVNPILSKIAKNEMENHALTEIRDWLLPMLMNGQVTVVNKDDI
jgi:type I restriction enzyme S subunit